MVPEGYSVSVAYACLLEVVRAIDIIITNDNLERLDISDKVSVEVDGREQSSKGKDAVSEDNCTLEADNQNSLHKQLINSSWCGLLAAFSMLLDAR